MKEQELWLDSMRKGWGRSWWICSLVEFGCFPGCKDFLFVTDVTYLAPGMKSMNLFSCVILSTSFIFLVQNLGKEEKKKVSKDYRNSSDTELSR